MQILIFLAGLILGGGLAWYIASVTLRARRAYEIGELKTQTQIAESKMNSLQTQLAEEQNEINLLRKALDQEEEFKTVEVTRLEELMKSFENEKVIFEKAKEDLINTFKALSDDALKSNNQAFLELAKGSLENVLKEAKGELGEKKESLKGLVGPLEKTLKQLETHVLEVENKREKDGGRLEEQIRSLLESQQMLQKETGSLASALRVPLVRGQWGEMTLKRVVELSGMSEHCDYVEQVSVRSEEGVFRPDMIIYLPSNKQVVIDSKVSLDGYLDSVEAVGDGNKLEAMVRHARQLRKHMELLSSKSYWSQFPNAPEFVVMFIPGEHFVSAAVANDKTLIEDGILNRVIIATPTTLIALLRAISYGWRQEQLAKNAQAIAEIGKQVYERFLAFLAHLTKMRTSLEQSVFNFNRTIGSLEGRVLPSLRKFKELGVTGADDIPTIEPIEQMPRALETKEVAEELNSDA